MSARLLGDSELVGGKPPLAPHMSILGTWDGAPYVDVGRIVERRIEIGERLYIGRHLVSEIAAAVGFVTIDDHKQLRRELEREQEMRTIAEQRLPEIDRLERQLVELTARAESSEMREQMLEQQLKEARAPKSAPLDIPVAPAVA